MHIQCDVVKIVVYHISFEGTVLGLHMTKSKGNEGPCLQAKWSTWAVMNYWK